MMFGIFTFLDFFAYSFFRYFFSNKILLKAYLFSNISLLILSIIVFIIRIGKISGNFQSYLVTFLIIIYLPKVVFLLGLIIDYIYRFVLSAAKFLREKQIKAFMLIKRSSLFNNIILGAYIFFVLYLFYGFLFGNTNYKIVRKSLYFESLPDSFDGLRIVQLSDLHLGSLGGKNNIEKIVNLINNEEPDIFVFTGDLINQTSEEITDVYKKNIGNIKAKLGKFSILGNHDYGKYFEWKNQKEKDINLQKIRNFYKEIGFTLLENKNISFRRDSNEIYLLGVENYGHNMLYGDLDEADFLLPNNGFKILLSHDPFHFNEVVKNYKNKIDLTLSGHTHGAQLGFNFYGKYISLSNIWNKKVVGLYEENGRKLYINRGIGVSSLLLVRAGMDPEITVFILKKKSL